VFTPCFFQQWQEPEANAKRGEATAAAAASGPASKELSAGRRNAKRAGSSTHMSGLHLLASAVPAGPVVAYSPDEEGAGDAKKVG
jgi:hypothetical protein